MHELSIAQSIIELSEEEARKAHAVKISRVEVEIGTMAGVEADALLFAWDSVVQGTMAQAAPLIIHSIQAEAVCLQCEAQFYADNFLIECPKCGSFRYRITRGKELRVCSLEVE